MKQTNTANPDGFTSIEGELWYSINDYSDMDPFFMSIISPDDLWMYISSTGGLTAGRRDTDHSLFPYLTSDRVTDSYTSTGSRTIVTCGSELWEPFARFYPYPKNVSRRLLKHASGSTLVFCETNTDLQLEFRCSWSPSPVWGWVRRSYLINHGQSTREIRLADGIRNILPSHVSELLERRMSNLVDAYKLSELVPSADLALFGLSSRVSDLAEASESLKVTTAWQQGLPDPEILLSEKQLRRIYRDEPCSTEARNEGSRAAFFCVDTLRLSPGEQRSWMMVLDVDQDRESVESLIAALQESRDEAAAAVSADLAASTETLRRLAGLSDGLQATSLPEVSEHHYANTMFNIMRGGLFIDGYEIQRNDLLRFIEGYDTIWFEGHRQFLESLDAKISLQDLRRAAGAYQSAEGSEPDRMEHLLGAYLPLAFSRRHGDPSRPWNKFSIQLKEADGSLRYHYEGNWRDIFQNWEPLAYSYPAYLPNMISVFVNGITLDGYNPYRVSRDGFSWERPDPDDPWANIGYWNDHQVIYLQKLLEAADAMIPEALGGLLFSKRFTAVEVPYRIAAFEQIASDPYDTIIFDEQLDQLITERCAKEGSIGKMLRDRQGEIHRMTLMEKLLIILLVKMTNFVPDGGIWMNTQRPEWNDANNALAGRGLSMVTLYYIRRMLSFLETLIERSRRSGREELQLHVDSLRLLCQIRSLFELHLKDLEDGFSDRRRKSFVHTAGKIGSAYRSALYEHGPSPETEYLSTEMVSSLLRMAGAFVDHSIQKNRREDGLYHAYNILKDDADGLSIGRLQLMLEGQVAVLSSGALDSGEIVSLLRSLRDSELYREDQHSYMLYPRVHVKGFLEKNTIDPQGLAGNELLELLLKRGDRSVIVQDLHGACHFAGDIGTKEDLQNILERMKGDGVLRPLVSDCEERVLSLFETTFDHERFTGRSGRMFAYEGNGSIYWHMVSKLLVAAAESVRSADPEHLQELAGIYQDIRRGLGFLKSAREYGAFPADPYSHSPWAAGAKQPGLTGHVKEELLSRMYELGVIHESGTIRFSPEFLAEEEFLERPEDFIWYDSRARRQSLMLEEGTLGFTICQVPVIYHRSSVFSPGRMHIHYAGGTEKVLEQPVLPKEDAAALFERDGTILRIDLAFTPRQGFC